MENVVKIIEALAWPIAMLILAFGFRTELRQVLGRITKFKYKELEATFDKELSEVEKRINLYEQPQEKISVETPSETSEYAHLLRISEVSPRAAIAESWRILESTLDSLAVSMGMKTKIPMGARAVIRSLVDTKRADPSIARDYNQLRNLRNQAVHADEFEITQMEAERYAASALEFSTFLKRFIKDS